MENTPKQTETMNGRILMTMVFKFFHFIFKITGGKIFNFLKITAKTEENKVC